MSFRSQRFRCSWCSNTANRAATYSISSNGTRNRGFIVGWSLTHNRQRSTWRKGRRRMPITTARQHEAGLHRPSFCELLPVRDFLDNVIVRTDGSFVAGYDLGGINSYYHSDDARNQTKYSLEALIRVLTERSMRMQVRFEVVEGLGDLPLHYKNQLRSDHNVV